MAGHLVPLRTSNPAKNREQDCTFAHASDQRPTSRMESPPTQSPQMVPLVGPSEMKRVAVSVACQRCRQKKTKVEVKLTRKRICPSWLIPEPQCDGKRPCVSCRTRRHECLYATEINETRRLAAVRRFQELSDRHDRIRTVHNVLTGEDEGQAFEMFRSLRTESPRRLDDSRLSSETGTMGKASKWVHLSQLSCVCASLIRYQVSHDGTTSSNSSRKIERQGRCAPKY